MVVGSQSLIQFRWKSNVCPLCPNCALDPLGYHCVTCKSGGDVTTRHNTLRNAVHSTFQRAGLSAHLEVGCGWGKDNARTRPADILVTNWDCGPLLPLTLLLHSRLILLICWKRACTRVFQLSQQNTESTPKTILSVLSWAGDAYHWQLRAMEPGVQRRRRPSHRWLLV